jgi:aspartate kinase
VPVLEAGSVAIVAGFQGVSRGGEITTLGRGGSDTSAVALGIALKAEKVVFFKDVEGIYESDPKTHPVARCYESLSFDAAYQIASAGAKVLHPRSIALAKKNGMRLHVMSFGASHSKGTLIGDNHGENIDLPLYEEVS